MYRSLVRLGHGHTPIIGELRGSFQLPPRDNKAYFVPAPTPRGAGKDMVAKAASVAHHAEGTAELWRRITMYIGLPLCLVYGVYIADKEYRHIKWVQFTVLYSDRHAREEFERLDGSEEMENLPPRYPYMGIRRKEMFWGNQSFLFNPVFQRRIEDE